MSPADAGPPGPLSLAFGGAGRLRTGRAGPRRFHSCEVDHFLKFQIGFSIVMGVPQVDGFLMEKSLLKWMIWAPVSGNAHMVPY